MATIHHVHPAVPQSDTEDQIDLLLRTAVTMANIVSAPLSDEILNRKNDPSGTVIDSAEATMISACNRIDRILSDDSRWNNEKQKKVDAATDEALKQQLAFLDAQRRAAEEVTKPHFKFRPTMARTPDGTGWLAFVGDPSGDPDNAIIGIGMTPAGALQSFDDVFNGELPKHMMDWLIARQNAINNGQIPPETPNTNEHGKMDTGGKSNIHKTPRRRKKSQ